jgi:cytoskeletal protein CcmA (bactofilin family)
MVIGNISTPRLIVEEGVVLNGNCVISKNVSFEEDVMKKESAAAVIAVRAAAVPEQSPEDNERHDDKTTDAFDPKEGREEFTSWNR